MIAPAIITTPQPGDTIRVQSGCVSIIIPNPNTGSESHDHLLAAQKLLASLNIKPDTRIIAGLMPDGGFVFVLDTP